MPYCTLQDLTDRYSQRMLVDISDRGDEATGDVDTALIGRAIADADALIDGYLKVRYALPLAAVPRLVTDLSLRIAIYYAHGHVAAEKIAADYKEAIRTLQEISRGVVQLDVDGLEPAESGGVEVRTNAEERVFTANTMRGYI